MIFKLYWGVALDNHERLWCLRLQVFLASPPPDLEPTMKRTMIQLGLLAIQISTFMAGKYGLAIFRSRNHHQKA